MLIACLLLQTHTKYSSNQGGQLPDVSLRSLYLLYCRLPYDFVLYMPKTTTFSYQITKQPASTIEFQYIYSILQKNLWAQTKLGKSAAGTSCAWAGLWPAVMLSISQSFQTFETQYVCNPGADFNYFQTSWQEYIILYLTNITR